MWHGPSGNIVDIVVNTRMRKEQTFCQFNVELHWNRVPNPKYFRGFRRTSTPTKVVSVSIQHCQLVLKHAQHFQGADQLIDLIRSAFERRELRLSSAGTHVKHTGRCPPKYLNQIIKLKEKLWKGPGSLPQPSMTFMKVNNHWPN